MNNAVFEAMKTVKQSLRDTVLISNDARKIYQAFIYHTKVFSDSLLPKKIKRTQIIINKAVYSGASILEASKTVTHEFWYDYVNPIYILKKIMLDVHTQLYNLHRSKEYLCR